MYRSFPALSTQGAAEGPRAPGAVGRPGGAEAAPATGGQGGAPPAACDTPGGCQWGSELKPPQGAAPTPERSVPPPPPAQRPPAWPEQARGSPGEAGSGGPGTGLSQGGCGRKPVYGRGPVPQSWAPRPVVGSGHRALPCPPCASRPPSPTVGPGVYLFSHLTLTHAVLGLGRLPLLALCFLTPFYLLGRGEGTCRSGEVCPPTGRLIKRETRCELLY